MIGQLYHGPYDLHLRNFRSNSVIPSRVDYLPIVKLRLVARDLFQTAPNALVKFGERKLKVSEEMTI